MREALTRRCARIVAGEYPTPDLLVIDGGEGRSSRRGRGAGRAGVCTQTPLIGIAKGPERKAGHEDIVFPDREAPSEPAARSSRACTCCSRFATKRTASRSRATGRGARKTRNTSSLQEIAGIGATRRQALLAHFGGLNGVQSASIDDLARVPGISRALAERIHAQLH